MDATKNENPKYKMAQLSYVDNKLIEEGHIYEDVGGKRVPGPHWEPVNDAAKAKAAACSVVFTGEVPDSIDELTMKLAKAKAAQDAVDGRNGNPELIAAAIVAALEQAGRLKPAPRARATDEV